MSHVWQTFVYPAVAGMLVGLLNYGALWWVLQRLHRRRRPAFVAGASFLQRTIAVTVVLYLLFADSWQQLMAALPGVLAARTALVGYVMHGAGPTGCSPEPVP